jgi:biopolymer transport protein ExbD
MKIERLKTKAPTLMLTPMLDMLTMILIFLIASFAPDEADLKKSPNIQLPASLHKIEAMPHVQIEITKDYVKLNGTSIDGLVPETGDNKAWAILKAKLEDLQKNAKDPEKRDPILLLADKGTAFRYIDRTVAHLAAAGYGSVYLVTETKKGEIQQ